MRRPLLQFTVLFCWVAGVAWLVIAIVNIIGGAGIWYELVINLPVMFAQFIVFVGVFTILAWLWFRRLFRVYQTADSAADVLAPTDVMRWRIRVSRYPFRLFVWFVVFAVSMSFAYHLADWAISRATGHGYAWNWPSFLQVFSFEQSLAWMLALLLYNGSQTILRPVLSWLAHDARHPIPYRVSLQRRIVIFAVAIAIVISSQYINMAASIPGGEHEMGALVCLAGVFILVSYICAKLAIRDAVKDIDTVRDSLTAFNQMDFPQSIQRLDVESADEVGDLKLQFNHLQDKVERYYRGVSSQLELAYRVQVGLLPAEPITVGRYVIEGRSHPAADLGGDFYDYLQSDEDTVAVLIGDVSGKGLPAALVTGLVLGLFRSEVRHGGTPREILSRMNRAVCSALTPEMYVSAGLMIIDVDTGAYRYASAGHLPPLLLRDSKVSEFELSSLPIGVADDTEFPEACGHVMVGDAVVLYTDGLVEARLRSGEMVGFNHVRAWVSEAADRIEGQSTDRADGRVVDGGGAGDAGVLDPCTALEQLVEEQCSPREDDQTVVWIQVRSAPVLARADRATTDTAPAAQSHSAELRHG